VAGADGQRRQQQRRRDGHGELETAGVDRGARAVAARRLAAAAGVLAVGPEAARGRSREEEAGVCRGTPPREEAPAEGKRQPPPARAALTLPSNLAPPLP
jgi:hypothetical protein